MQGKRGSEAKRLNQVLVAAIVRLLSRLQSEIPGVWEEVLVVPEHHNIVRLGE